jgi:hypothetical protein
MSTTETPSAEGSLLTPPLPELPPPAWKNPVVIASVVGGIAAVAIIVVVVRWIQKNRPRPGPADLALAALAKAEGLVVLTRVLRDYLGAVEPAHHAGLTHEEIVRLVEAGTPLPTADWMPLLSETAVAKYAGGSAPSDLRERIRKLVNDTESTLAQKRAEARRQSASPRATAPSSPATSPT